MPTIRDSRAIRQRVSWGWRCAIEPRFIVWFVLMAVALLFHLRMWGLVAESNRLARAAGQPSSVPMFHWYGPLWNSAFLMLVIGVGALSHYRALTRRLADRRAIAGQCPCCGYDLTGLAPASDGCRVCPECAAAWDTYCTKADPR